MCRRNYIFMWLIGLILGIGSAVAWYFGYVLYVREMLPYAIAFGIILFVTTAVLRFAYGDLREWKFGIRKLSPLVLITAAIFIVVGLFVLATYLSMTLRMTLAIVGSISFWMMLLGFITMILSRPCRR